MQPPTHRSRLSWFVVAAVVQLGFLLWAARVAIPQGLQCEVCDTAYYYTAAAEIAKSGLLFTNPYDGYRSYFVPLFIATVEWLAASAGFGGSPVERYAYGVSILFWLISAALMWRLAGRVNADVPDDDGRRVLNRFLLVYVPSRYRKACSRHAVCPFCLLGLAPKTASGRARAGDDDGVVAYIIRASLVWWLLLSASYAAWLCGRRSGSPPLASLDDGGCPRRLRAHRPPGLYFAQKSGSFNPYPFTSLLTQQTVASPAGRHRGRRGHWRGLGLWSPLRGRTRRTRPPVSTRVVRSQRFR
jgi:hypothetical protein